MEGKYDEPEPEVIDSTARVVEDRADPETGEVRDTPQPQRQAIGGGVIPAPARRAGDLVNMLEDGQLSYEMQEQLAEVARQVREMSLQTGAKVKGEVTLKLSLVCDNGEAIQIQGTTKAKLPELPRRKSILWQDEDGSFITHPPRQAPMFGVRTDIRRIG
jgi:hypothetical protein